MAKKRLASQKGAAAKKGAVSKGKKKQCDKSDKEALGLESVEDSEEASSSESSSDGEDEDRGQCWWTPHSGAGCEA